MVEPDLGTGLDHEGWEGEVSESSAQQDPLPEIQRSLQSFADERNWLQFHSPKNLAMAVASEAGELLEVFQWLTEDASKKLSEEDHLRAADELADVAIYLIRLADVLDLDLWGAIRTKMAANALRFPVDQTPGHLRRT